MYRTLSTLGKAPNGRDLIASKDHVYRFKARAFPPGVSAEAHAKDPFTNLRDDHLRALTVIGKPITSDHGDYDESLTRTRDPLVVGEVTNASFADDGSMYIEFEIWPTKLGVAEAVGIINNMKGDVSLGLVVNYTAANDSVTYDLDHIALCSKGRLAGTYILSGEDNVNDRRYQLDADRGRLVMLKMDDLSLRSLADVESDDSKVNDSNTSDTITQEVISSNKDIETTTSELTTECTTDTRVNVSSSPIESTPASPPTPTELSSPNEPSTKDNAARTTSNTTDSPVVTPPGDLTKQPTTTPTSSSIPVRTEPIATTIPPALESVALFSNSQAQRMQELRARLNRKTSEYHKNNLNLHLSATRKIFNCSSSIPPPTVSSSISSIPTPYPMDATHAPAMEPAAGSAAIPAADASLGTPSSTASDSAVGHPAVQFTSAEEALAVAKEALDKLDAAEAMIAKLSEEKAKQTNERDSQAINNFVDVINTQIKTPLGQSVASNYQVDEATIKAYQDMLTSLDPEKRDLAIRVGSTIACFSAACGDNANVANSQYQAMRQQQEMANAQKNAALLEDYKKRLIRNPILDTANSIASRSVTTTQSTPVASIPSSSSSSFSSSSSSMSHIPLNNSADSRIVGNKRAEPDTPLEQQPRFRFAPNTSLQSSSSQLANVLQLAANVAQRGQA